ncbi:hypothetical protein FB451DRAFT_1557857 [Mycena latifolia]|nr:hypothetical protein FB451DRAFT_1557857 [Mycena latifolia]
MRSISTLFLLSSASALGAAVRGTTNTTISARADGGFVASCRDIAISNDSPSNPLLEVFCINQEDQFIGSGFSLNECVANNNGVLACRAGGNHGKSCSTFQFSSGTILHATCKNNAGANTDGGLTLPAAPFPIGLLSTSEEGPDAAVHIIVVRWKAVPSFLGASKAASGWATMLGHGSAAAARTRGGLGEPRAEEHDPNLQLPIAHRPRTSTSSPFRPPRDPTHKHSGSVRVQRITRGGAAYIEYDEARGRKPCHEVHELER